jgi:hypothetical protein
VSLLPNAAKGMMRILQISGGKEHFRKSKGRKWEVIIKYCIYW